MNYGSVCSGIEAATAAWHSLGWKPTFFSEIEPFPCAVLAHHYPAVPNFGDMTKFQEWPDANIDVLVGGTPCQSFSVAGLRKGLADPRGNLMLTFGAIAKRYRPRWLVWENVPGVLSSNEGRDFGTFLGMLGELGYGFAYRILDAQFAGVPQRRRRVFVVGCLGDWRRAAAVLLERESLRGNPPPRRQARKGTAADVARSLAIRGRDGTPQAELGDDVANALLTPSGGRAGIGVGAIMQSATDIAPAITSDPYGDHESREGLLVMSSGQSNAELATDVSTTLTTLHEAPIVAHALTANGFDASEDGTGREAPLVTVKLYQDSEFGVGEYDSAGALRAGRIPEHQMILQAQPGAFAQNSRDEVRIFGGDGGIVGALAAEPGMKQQSYLAFSGKDYGADAGEIAPTIRAGGHADSHPNGGIGPAIASATAVRRLTPRECERLQGFSDDFTLIPVRGKPAADGPRYKALGNSMAVPVMRWIGERIELVSQIAERRAA